MSTKGKTRRQPAEGTKPSRRHAAEAEAQATAYSPRLLLALSQAAQSVQRVRTAAEVYRTVGKEAAGLGYNSSIFTLAPDRSHLVIEHLTLKPGLLKAAEKLTGLSVKDFRFPLAPGGFYQRIIATGETVFSTAFTEPIAEALPAPLRPLAGQLAALLHIEQAVVAPLVVGGETVGLLTVSGRGLTEADAPAVTVFANQIANALENTRLYQETRTWAAELERRVAERTVQLEAANKQLEGEIAERKRAEEEIRQRNEDLSLFDAINQAINRGESLESIIRLIAQETERMFNSFGMTLHLFSPDRQRLVMQNLAIPPALVKRIEKLIGIPIPRIEHDLQAAHPYRQVLESGRPQLINELEGVQEFTAAYLSSAHLTAKARARLKRLIPAIIKLLGYQCVLVAPLISGGEIIGTMDMGRRAPLFGEEDAQRLESIAGQLTAVLMRKRAEERITASEAELRALFAAMTDMVIVYDAAGRYIKIAPTNPVNFYRPADAMLGKSVHEIFPKEQADFFVEQINKTLQSGQVMQCEYALQIGGKEVWFSANVSLLSANTVIWVAHDITERRRAEEALRASEQRLKEAQNLGQIGDWTFDVGSQIITWSDQVYALYERDPSLGPPTAEEEAAYYKPEQAQILQEYARRAVEEGESFEYDLEAQLHGGRSAYFTATMRPVKDKDDRIISLIGTVQDITERKRTEKALSESEERYRDLVENSQDLISTHDLEGRILSVNQTASQALGYAADEWVNKKLSDFMPPGSEDEFKEYLATIKKQGIASGFLRVLTRAGETRIWEYNNNLRQVEGEASTVRSMARDVTERWRAEKALRASEERFAKAFQSNPIATSISSLPEGRLVDINQAFLQLTGYSREEVIGRSGRELGLWVKPEDRKRFEQLLLEKHTVQNAESLLQTKSGERRDILTSAEIIALHGQPHFLTMLYDITERKQRERELEAIAAVSAALRATATRAEMLPVILDQLLTLLNVEGAALEMLDAASGELLVELGRGIWESVTGESIPPGEGLSAQVLASGQPYLNNEARRDPRLFRPDLFGDCRAAASAPLAVKDSIIGLLWIGSQRLLSDHDLRLLTAIADIAASAIHRAALYEQTERRLRQLTTIRTIDQTISGSLDLRLTLNIIVQETAAQLKADAAAVLLLEPHSLTLEYAAGRGFHSRAIEQTRVRLGEGHTGRAALEQRTLSLPNLAAMESDARRAALIESEGFVSHHAIPLIVKGQVRGVLEVFQRARFEAEAEWLNFFEALAGQAAIAIENSSLFDGLQRSNVELALAYDATIEGWSRAMDLRDKETEGHTRRVTELALQLARAMGVSDEKIIHLRRGALLHDIGKLGVSDTILLKPGKLSAEEWEVMRQHPQYAHDMLASIEYLKPALDIPYCHHEKWDGSGYPRGLKGEEIPLAARIFAVADVWDALLSNRPYRKAWRREKALEYIGGQSGKHFDPQVVRLFLKIVNV